MIKPFPVVFNLFFFCMMGNFFLYFYFIFIYLWFLLRHSPIHLSPYHSSLLSQLHIFCSHTSLFLSSHYHLLRTVCASTPTSHIWLPYLLLLTLNFLLSPVLCIVCVFCSHLSLLAYISYSTHSPFFKLSFLWSVPSRLSSLSDNLHIFYPYFFSLSPPLHLLFASSALSFLLSWPSYILLLFLLPLSPALRIVHVPSFRFQLASIFFGLMPLSISPHPFPYVSYRLSPLLSQLTYISSAHLCLFPPPFNCPSYRLHLPLSPFQLAYIYFALSPNSFISRSYPPHPLFSPLPFSLHVFCSFISLLPFSPLVRIATHSLLTSLI